jgi:hypothetical protein
MFGGGKAVFGSKKSGNPKEWLAATKSSLDIG